MENSIICPNCGKENAAGSRFCTGCGTKLVTDTSNTPEVSNTVQSTQNVQSAEEADGNATLLGVISLVLFFGCGAIIAILSAFLPNGPKQSLSSLVSLCPLAGIVTMVVGRVKYPTNKFLKTVMWTIMGFIIVASILSVLFFIWCFATCATMDMSGCN